MRVHRRRPDLLNDPVPLTILRLIGPMMVGALGIVMFNLVDTFFVGRLGAIQLAAMGFTFPIVLVAGSIGAGLGVGASANVARALGAGDREGAERLTAHALVLGLGIVLALSAVGLLTVDPLFTALGASAEVLPYIRRYITVWYIGLPFVVLPMIGQNVLQATGDTRLPAMIISGAVTLNIILDPLLMFGLGPVPALGIQGAAIATVIARGSTFFVVTWALVRRERLLRLPLRLRQLAHSARSILFVGLPAALTNLALPLSMGVVTRLIADYGALAVAGFGVATRVESFSLIFTLALSMVFTPFVGQNFGAGHLSRVRQGFQFAASMSFVWGVFAMVVFWVAAQPIARVFNDSRVVVDTATRYLWLVSPSFGLMGIVNVGAAAFNGVHRPLSAMSLAFLRLFGLFIPFAVIGRVIGDLSGLFAGLAVANAVAGVAAFIWVRRSICRNGGCRDTKQTEMGAAQAAQPVV
jgi:putative MATE family efflux protein